MNLRRTLPLLLAGLSLASGALASASTWLIATAQETQVPGQALQLETVRPDAGMPWPEQLQIRLRTAQGQEQQITLMAQGAPEHATRHRYTGQLPGELHGLVRAELAEHPSNRLALLLEAPAAMKPDTPQVQAFLDTDRDPLRAITHSPVGSPPTLDPIPEAEPALSAHEAVYLVFGGQDGANARFQLSFKYRLLDPESAPVRLAPFLGNLHFGYTQTSLWDLHGESKPFRDTSYRPSFFWQGKLDKSLPLLPDYLRGGYEHESNGKDGDSSRSIDTLFIQPAWRWSLPGDNSLILAPKFYGYLEKDDNPDIARYRGYGDWIIRVGNERGWMLASRLRLGTAGYGSGQLDLSVPLRDPLFSRTGGFLHFQLFSGYGESLLDYNLRQEPQFRVGFSIVR